MTLFSLGRAAIAAAPQAAAAAAAAVNRPNVHPQRAHTWHDMPALSAQLAKDQGCRGAHAPACPSVPVLLVPHVHQALHHILVHVIVDPQENNHAAKTYVSVCAQGHDEA